MRRETILVYLLSSAKFSTLWQYAQPCCGETQLVIETIKAVNCAVLKLPKTLTFLYAVAAFGPSAGTG